MNSSNSATTKVKPLNGMPEQKLKQALLPFKATPVKKTTPEIGKKRKHEDEAANTSETTFIDLTDGEIDNKISSTTDDDVGVQSNKVCIISAEPKPESSSGETTTPSSKSTPNKKLTPSQKRRREELEMKRLEKEKLKKEKEKKRLEEKEEKQRQKEEKEKKRLAEIEAKNEEKRQKEEERKAKEEEKKRQKEEERKQKEEERRQKEEERKLKEEERKHKEEERKQKEEERKQKEEQKRLKEEQERKSKEKSAAVLSNFFLPKSKETSKEPATEIVKAKETIFMPFEVKENMRVATVERAKLTQASKLALDDVLKNDDLPEDSLYLARLKSKSYKPGRSENTWPVDATEDDDDLMIVDDEHSLPATERPMRYRCKLLQFTENRRPAYWGTWRKKSKKVSGRAPFKQDEIFDYEIDSDEEWEDEPGEDLEGDSEDEKEPEDEYEVDNELFVPHGYLSDEEGQVDDSLELSPKSNKLKLNVMEKQFEEERKEKTRKLKPRVYGCIWIDNDVKEGEGANNVENLLLQFRAVFDESKAPFSLPVESKEATPQNTPSVKSKLKNEFPDTLLPDLVKLAHGNKRNTKLLAKEFNAYVLSKDPALNLTFSCIIKKLKEISTWVSNLACRIVNEEVRSQCELTNLSHMENTWKYCTMVDESATEKLPKEAEKSTIMNPPTSVNVPVVKEISNITKYVKKLTPEEKQMAFEMAAEKNDKQIAPQPIQKPKSTNDITKFITKIKSCDKTELKSDKEPSQAVSIDLTSDNEGNIDGTESPVDKSSSANTPQNDQNTSTSKNESVLPCTSGSLKESSGGCDVESSIRKVTPDKPVNILVPRKLPKSPSVNILIPRKTPTRPITSVNAKTCQSKGLISGDEKSPDVFTPKMLLDALNTPKSTEDEKPPNVFTPKRLLESLNAMQPPKSAIAVSKRKYDSENSKPGGPIAKRASCSKEKSSKPVNILIPRRAKDLKKNDTVVKSKPVENEKPKDGAVDDNSSDFSLRIDSNDVPEVEMNDVEMKAEN